MMHRRDLFHTAMTVGAASVLDSKSARSAEIPTPSKIIDTNISLSQWPFRLLPLDDLESLVTKLRSLGITEAWAGSFEGLLHRDVTSVNERLTEACRLHSELLPVGSINLELPGWEHDLRLCIEKHGMHAVRLHPNYHSYTLSDPRLSQLLKRATARGLLVQIAVAMEDTRTQHPLVQVPDVDLSPLAKLMREPNGAKVQLLNLRPRGAILEELAKTPGIFFDTARVDGTDSVATLMRSVPPGRVLFGTHAPFLVPEAALIRVYESELNDAELKRLTWESADRVRKVQPG